MTLGRIKLLALKMLDEAPEDIGEYDELFRLYANMGYAIAMREYIRPRAVRMLVTDRDGRAVLTGMDIVRVVEVRDEKGMRIPFDQEAEGGSIRTGKKEKTLSAVCEILWPDMREETDEPKMPEYAHAVLADYICYRHLSSGNLAKQNRAQFFFRSFLQQMQSLRREGQSGVTRLRNLYEATDIRSAAEETGRNNKPA